MLSNHRSLRLGLAALAALAPTLAFAHPGVAGHTHGFLHGFSHPIGGIDHILAMVAVGIFAANLGGRALWAVPLTFMGFMAVGGTLGILGVPLPFVEVGIAMSIVVLGIAVAVNWDWPVTAAMAMVGLFAVFHGHAHGTEMPLDASGAAYAAGFVAASCISPASASAAQSPGPANSPRTASRRRAASQWRLPASRCWPASSKRSHR